MGKILALIFALFLSSCFKKHNINENALLQQRACLASMELKDYDRAQVHCELCLEYDKAMPECLNGIGLIALAKNDREKARVYFTRAVRQNNDFSHARNNLGVIYFSEGEFAKSLRYFNQSLEIDPSNIDARYNKGLSHFRLAQRAKANNHYIKSLKQLAFAKEQMHKLIALEPTFQNAYRDLGLIELNRYDLTEFTKERSLMLEAAHGAFSTCLEINDVFDACYEGLAQVLVEMGHYDKAFVNYFHCLAHEPGNSSCRRGIVGTLEKSAHAEGGYQKFVSALQKNQENAPAHYAFCAELFERGFDAEAQKECEIALRLKPNICPAHFSLAKYFASVFNASRASQHCHAFLACDSGDKQTKELDRCREILAALRE